MKKFAAFLPMLIGFIGAIIVDIKFTNGWSIGFFIAGIFAYYNYVKNS